MTEYICPSCQNPIYDEEALLCHFCGESLRRSGAGVLGKIRYGKGGLLLLAVAVLVLIGMFGFIIL